MTSHGAVAKGRVSRVALAALEGIKAFLGMDTDLFLPNTHSGTRVTRDVHVAFHDPTSWTKTSSCPSGISISVVSHQLRCIALSSRINRLTCSPFMSPSFHGCRKGGKSSCRRNGTNWTSNHHPQTTAI